VPAKDRRNLDTIDRSGAYTIVVTGEDGLHALTSSVVLAFCGKMAAHMGPGLPERQQFADQVRLMVQTFIYPHRYGAKVTRRAVKDKMSAVAKKAPQHSALHP
jgi:hypothetical protein